MDFAARIVLKYMHTLPFDSPDAFVRRHASRTVSNPNPPPAVALPQFKRGDSCGTLRHSKRGKWRAATLITVYLLAIAHLLHWYFTGQSISPVEPSESMQTVSDGLVNAGFVFFAIALLATLVFGRFVCGWACHFVAPQDLCTWLLHRIGLRPKPFRSRLLMWIPLAVAIYMFILPILQRLWLGRDLPELRSHLLTDDMWQTFPGVTMSVLSFIIAGFLVVYFLGNKGFCFYACPYGGFFGPVDRLAPGKIRVTDACEGCGHCTASCTSNVRVHEEVRTYGMVVDTGCMKCLDCIDVCPKNALYFGFGVPALFAGAPRAPRRKREFDFTLLEELAMVAFFAFTIYAIRGLYLTEPIPLLLSLSIAGISAYLMLLAVRMLYAPSVRLHTWIFKKQNRLAPVGVAFAIVGVGWSAFLARSAVLQYHTREGSRLSHEALRTLDRAPFDRDAARALAARSIEQFEKAQSWQIVESPWVHNALCDLHYFLATPADINERLAKAEENARSAIRIEPDIGGARATLARTFASRNDMQTAYSWAKRELEKNPGARGVAAEFVQYAIAANQMESAITVLQTALDRRPLNAEVRLELGCLILHVGDAAVAEQQLNRAVKDAADRRAARQRIAQEYLSAARILLSDNHVDDAYSRLTRALEFEPQLAPAHFFVAQILKRRGDLAGCRTHLDAARAAFPNSPQILQFWAGFLAETGDLAKVTADFQERTQRAAAEGKPDDIGEFQLAFLYHAAGNQTAADQIMNTLRTRRPDLFPPANGN